MRNAFWKVVALVVLPTMVWSQEVSNVHFEQVGKKIHVYYDLIGTDSYNITMHISQDNGVTWVGPLRNVTGDIGMNREVGMNKEIIWDALSEVDQIRGDIRFRITASPLTEGSFVDNRDGQHYTWRKIGEQIWMNKNLNYKTGKSYCYENNVSNCELYGRLYVWNSARNVCPNGWHLPTDDEWKILETFLGLDQNDIDYIGLRGTDEGEQIKSNIGWNGNGNGTNNVGFSAFPGGCRSNGGSYSGFGDDGYWWTATGSSGIQAWSRGLSQNTDQLIRYSSVKTFAFSVRCVKDN